jgi:hypothetical protein
MSVQRSPLIFALKHLHIEWDDREVNSPSQFRRSVSLMQGKKRIPAAAGAKIDALLKEECQGALPQGVELKLLQLSCPGWPQDVVIAFHGISNFGAGAIEIAKASAQHVLKAHRDCLLARQLVSLLTAQSEVRCPLGADAGNAPDVPGITAVTQTRGKGSAAPKSPDGIRFRCPGCTARIVARADNAGRKAKCPACGTAVSVPTVGT